MGFKPYYLLFLILLTGCASGYKVSDYELDAYYRRGYYEQAISGLKQKILEVDKKDQLIYELNLALAYQANGQYKESNEEFFKIKEKLNWDKVFKLKESALAFALNDNYKEFKVAEYEQLMIQFYIALNFANMNNWQSALVEVRHLDYILYQLRQINENFSFLDKTHLSYFSALVYEANHKYDEAFIDYQRAFNHSPKLPYLGFDLYRTAQWAGRSSEAKKYAQLYNIPVQYQKYVINKYIQNTGEMVVVFQNGVAPYKVEHKGWSNIPVYQPRAKMAEEAKIKVDGEEFGQTYVLLDLESMAINFQQAQIKTLFKEDMARTVLKEVAAWSIGLSGGFLGVVTARTIAQSSSGADLRTWFFLPKEIQIARVNLKTGSKKLQVNFNDIDTEHKDLKIKANKKTISTFKYGGNL